MAESVSLFRGTQRPDLEGILKSPSYTISLPIAIIWSSQRPDVWLDRPAKFLPTSTVHEAKFVGKDVLRLSGESYTTFGHILDLLRYGKRGGIEQEEAAKILQYIHNRLVGKAKGGDFLYTIVDEDGEEVDEGDLPLSFEDPTTLVREFKEEFEVDDSIADRLEADTFIFADAPAVQRAALKLGYDVLVYPDVFTNVQMVSDKLLGIPAEEMKGVEMDYDLKGDQVYIHETYRPLKSDVIEVTRSIPTMELLKGVERSDLVQQG